MSRNFLVEEAHGFLVGWFEDFELDVISVIPLIPG